MRALLSRPGGAFNRPFLIIGIAVGLTFPSIAMGQQTPSYYQNSSPSYSTGGETSGTGGGYATQAQQAGQAKQATQSTQTQGYKSPYSNLPQTGTGSNTTTTTTNKPNLLMSPSLPATNSGSGTTVDYYSSKGTTGTYVIPDNLIPAKPHPDAVLQGEIVIHSDTNPELNETITLQEQQNGTSNTGSTPIIAAPKQVLPLGAVGTSSQQPGSGTTSSTTTTETVAPNPNTTSTTVTDTTVNKGTNSTEIIVNKTTTTVTKAPASEPISKSAGTPAISSTPTTITNAPKSSSPAVMTKSADSPSLLSSAPKSTAGSEALKEEVSPIDPAINQSSASSTELKKEEESTGAKTTTATAGTSTLKEVQEESAETDAAPAVNTASTPKTESYKSNESKSSYNKAAKKAEEDALRKAKMQEASGARLGSKDRAKALLGTNSEHMNSAMHQDLGAASDSPRQLINFGEINSLSASIGQFIREGVALAAIPPSVTEDEPVCAGPEISKELQEQLDKEKKELEEALRKARERLEKEKKKLADDKEADEKIKNRKKVKEAQKKLNDKFKDLAEDRQELSEERDALDDKKEKAQDKYDDARKKEYEARKGPPADPNCRSANCRQHRDAQADARKSLNEVQKGEQEFQKKVREFEKAEREYQKDADAFEEALDRGYGQTKDQWKERMLDKQDRALREQKQEMAKRIEALEKKAKGGTADSRADKQKLKEMDRQIDEVKRKRKAAQEYVERNSGKDGSNFDKIMEARGFIEDADKFIRDHSSLSNEVDYQDSVGRGLNSSEARELDRLKKNQKTLNDHLEDKKNGPAYQARDLREKMAKEGIPNMQESLSSFGGMLDTEARDRKLAALEQGIDDLKAAEERVQNFKGQPDAQAQKEAVEADKKAQAELKELNEQRNNYRDSLPTEYPDKSKDITAAKQEIAELENNPQSSWQDRQNAKENLEKLERAQSRHEREYQTHNRKVDEKYGQKIDAAEEKAELSGYRALGAKGQQIVSEYNRGLPDVFGADGKVDPAKVNRVAGQIDKQLNDLGQLNGELGRLNQVRSNLLPSKDGEKSLAAQAGMSPKAIDARLKEIDGRIQTASGYRDQLRSGLKKLGFESDVNATGQCQINSVNSAMGAAYVKGTRAAAANQSNKPSNQVAAAGGTASPAANAIAKNTSNVQQAKQAQQYQTPGSGGGQCTGSGAPTVSCADNQNKDRGVRMADRVADAALQTASIASRAAKASGTVLASEPTKTVHLGDKDQRTELQLASTGLASNVLEMDRLLGETAKGSIAHQVFAQQRLAFKTAKDAIDQEIIKLDKKEAAGNTIATHQFEKAINDIDGTISDVEALMTSVQDAGIPGLLPALDAQRDALFAGRSALSQKLATLKQEETAAPETSSITRNATPVSLSTATPKDPIIEQDKIKEIVKVLDENIKGVSNTENAFKQSGQPVVAQVFTNQRVALQTVRDEYLAQIQQPPRGPAGIRVFNTSLGSSPTSQTNVSAQSPEQVELDRTRNLVNWINTGLLPAFKKDDALAQQVLPGILLGLIKELGATTADEIIDETADYMEDQDLDPSGAVFIDELLKRARAETTPTKSEEQLLIVDLARVQFLKQVLLDKDKALSEQERAELEQSASELRESVSARIEKQLKGLDNKPDAIIHKLAALADLASLPGATAKDLKPLLDQIERHLVRIEKGDTLLSHENTQSAVHRLKQALDVLQKGMSVSPEFQQRHKQLSDLLERTHAQEARLYKYLASQGSDADQLRRANSQLAQSHQAMRGGDFKRALDLIEATASNNPSVKLGRSIALIDTLNNLERIYALLPKEQRDKLGELSKLLEKRDQAIADVLEISTNPKLVATLLLGNAERLARDGKFKDALVAITTGLEKRPNDEALIGAKFKIELLAQGADLDSAKLDGLIKELPSDAKLSAGLIAARDLIARGEDKAAALLIEKLRAFKDIPTDQKANFEIQVDFAEISLLSNRLGLGADEAALRKLLNAFSTKLTAAEGLDDAYRKALQKAATDLVAQIDQAHNWTKKLADKSVSIETLQDIIRGAMRNGRYDIAGPALKAQMEKLLRDAGPKEIQMGMQQATRLLDAIRLRMNGPDVSVAQKEFFKTFLKEQGAGVTAALDKYLAERMDAAGKAARNAALNKKRNIGEAEYRYEMRQLAGLKIRLELLLTDEKDRLKKMNELRSAARQAVAKHEAQIRSDFDDRGLLLRDKDYDKARLAGAIAELNQLRAASDGMDDYYFENAGQYIGPDTRTELWYGTFKAANHREAEMKAIQRQLAGVYANGRSATEIWNTRKNYSMTSGRGLREKTIANHKNDPRDREYESNPDKYKNFWLEMALDDAELAYKDNRRAELINEDPTRSIPEKAKLYEFFVNAEAKYLRDLVGSSNPLLEMFEKIAQTGRLMTGAAKKLEASVAINDKNQLLNEYQSALLDKDPQRLFRALVPLRDASLAGEINAFVNYLHEDWTSAGPARAYNLMIGMDATKEAIEQITAESQKVQLALIRAGHNLPGQLSMRDQDILIRHGFLTNGKYTIPDQIKLDPTKVGSEFVDLTKKGRLATVDRFLNARQGAELFATVALPGGIAGKFGRAVSSELLALGGIRTLTGRALAYGTGLAAEAGAFTALSKGARVALDPSLALQDQFWSRETLVKEYAHNLLIIGALKGFGKGAQELGKRAKGLADTAKAANSYARAVENIALMGEAGLLTGMNSLLESNQITQDDYLGNLLTIVLLKGTNKVLEGGEKSASTKLQEARINKILEYMGKGPLPGTGPTTRVSQIRDSLIREYNYETWLSTVDKPTKLLLEKYGGNWDKARKAYQTGELSAADMRSLVNLRREIVDSLAAEIVKEMGVEVQAFGSENLTSDYDISFVGPKAQLAVIVFNARFASRWGKASGLGGRETGVVLDTNAYTETIQSLFKAGRGDTVFQDGFAHMASRKYLGDKSWAAHRKWILENTPEARRSDVQKVLDFAEASHLEFKTQIELKMAELSADKNNPIRESDLRITAENRLYEQALKEIIELRAQFENSSGPAKEALRQQLRNAQSKALYFAQEAYHTQGAIEHVVMSLQAAKRKITVESLTSDTPPKLKVELTAEQGRQSYFEQIANMMKEISHKGDGAKLASKGAKYFIRALDAAQIAGLKLAKYKALIEQVVALDLNRADLDAVREILAAEKIKAAEEAKGVELTPAERTAIQDAAAKEFLTDIQVLSNELTGKLYDGQTLRVVENSGLRRLELKTEAMSTRDIIDNIDAPTQTLMERFKGNWNKARKAYQTGELSAVDMRLLVNLRRRIVDSLAAEIVKELGVEVEAFGSENLTSDYDISFVGPKAQLAVILFNARFAAGWGQAAKIGGRETGTVLDTNAYTETIQSLIKAGKGDVTYQDAFSHLAGRKNMPAEVWEAHRKLILENAAAADRPNIEIMLRWVEAANDVFKARIEARKKELLEDPNSGVKAEDAQITAENRLYEEALKDIIELREQFEAADATNKEPLRLKLRNAQSRALYFAQEAYHTQGAIEHVVMSIQAAGRKITIESLLSENGPTLKKPLTADQGRQSYFEQVANMLKEILHEGDPAKLASKGAKYFVRALDAAQIAGLKLQNLRSVVEMTVQLNDNRANLDKVRDILANDAIQKARAEKGSELTKAEIQKIRDQSAEVYLEAIQKAANQLTSELYQNYKLEGVERDVANEMKLELPEPANDNLAFSGEKIPAGDVAAPKPATTEAKGAETVAKSPEVVKAGSAIEGGTVRTQREIKFELPGGEKANFLLGDYVAKGATSYIYRHVMNLNWVYRLVRSGARDAHRADEFGRKVLKEEVDTQFVRGVKVEKTIKLEDVETDFFRSNGVRVIEIVEYMKDGTAADLMKRPEQNGQLTEGQRLALDQGTRELNRKGYAWLDNKTDNYTFERMIEGKDVWRLVILDPGGIVPMHGQSAHERFVNARELQARINVLEDYMIELLDRHKGAPKFVANDITRKIKAEHVEKINFDKLGIEIRYLAYSPIGYFNLRRAGELFAMNEQAANDNYDAYIQRQLGGE